MSREIKFRIYDPDNFEMFPVEDENVNLILEGGEIVAMTYDLFDREVGGEHEQTYEWTKHPEYTLMQFTGLTDKNGKEIYEGDIVRSCPVHDDDEGELFELRVFEIKFKGCQFQLFRGDQPPAWDLNYSKNEIIGNIHENPDLLQAAS